MILSVMQNTRVLKYNFKESGATWCKKENQQGILFRFSMPRYYYRYYTVQINIIYN